jgi:hypothetical protein
MRKASFSSALAVPASHSIIGKLFQPGVAADPLRQSLYWSVNPQLSKPLDRIFIN